MYGECMWSSSCHCPYAGCPSRSGCKRWRSPTTAPTTPREVSVPGQLMLQATEAPSLLALEVLRLPGKVRRNKLDKKSGKNVISHKSLGREKSPAGYIFQSNLEKTKEIKGFHILHCHLSWCFPAHRLPQLWNHWWHSCAHLLAPAPAPLCCMQLHWWNRLKDCTIAEFIDMV